LDSEILSIKWFRQCFSGIY